MQGIHIFYRRQLRVLNKNSGSPFNLPGQREKPMNLHLPTITT
ncbi:hypothetical protein GJA_5090 [Janthinobacterium agaricidamnosum NBRC 102515 = DSM 9628]|uniref:Uncharacterized protein n=1 Tax=Janthinobacterium agaricidamnosum NBRC 102515 = DSM 9628 TaxID=1349767 RepID=W0VE44_9BURK|nr:hypothetical protein GJA_5090 [Janthinobacterium agaricidamnosum NBRC 102515 = DSM 9628]